MKKISKLIIFLVIAAAAFYFRADLAAFYLQISKQLPDIKNISFDELIQDIEKQVSLPPPLLGPQEQKTSLLTAQGVIEFTNEERRINGASPLAENQKLNAAAMAKAKDILLKQYFEHVSPTGEGPAILAKNAGYEYIRIGENLALGNFSDDQALVSAWMASPGHRENILNPRFKEIGVAAIKGTYQNRTVWVAVQEFGTPASDCPKPDVSPKNQIELLIAQAKELAQTIEIKRAQLESGQFKNNSEFNKAAREHNELVARYNSLADQIEKLSADYSQLVKIFNECINQ